MNSFLRHLLFLVLLPTAPVFGQNFFEQLRPVKLELGHFPFESMNRFTALRMDFGKPHIHNPKDWSDFSGDRKALQVDLVFTRYPVDLESWEVNYDSLMQNRFRALRKIAPELFEDPGITWRLVLQTGGRSLADAKSMFHGFVITYRPLKEVDNDMAATWDYINQLLEEEVPFRDSTAMRVLNRHPEWKNMLVVTDWTASMYPFGAQVLLWHKENIHQGRIRHLAFFNDGDDTPDKEKEPGNTGGIYLSEDRDMASILETIEKTTYGGKGGDFPENDMEAVLTGIDAWDDYDEIILIADNRSRVRDLRFVKEIDKPIHIVLCGVIRGEIHPHYLTIAAWTGGSVHTLEEDLENLPDKVENGILNLGEHHYKYRKGLFKKYKIPEGLGGS